MNETNKSTMIEHINLIDGMNLQPITLEASNEMTTTGWLMAIQDKINKIIDMGNAWEKSANDYTDDLRNDINKEFAELQKLIDTGEIVKDGTLTFKKMNTDFINDFQDFIIQKVYEATKFVFFGLEKDYFCAYFPDSFNDFSFSTDIDGHLCLEY